MRMRPGAALEARSVELGRQPVSSTRVTRCPTDSVSE
jgi:hypothetical protein